MESWGFPGGPVVKNLPANQEDLGSTPSGWKLHIARSNETRARQLLKATHLEPGLHKRSHRNEQPTYHKDGQTPSAPTRESPRIAMKTQRSQK